MGGCLTIVHVPKYKQSLKSFVNQRGDEYTTRGEDDENASDGAHADRCGDHTDAGGCQSVSGPNGTAESIAAADPDHHRAAVVRDDTVGRLSRLPVQLSTLYWLN